MKIWFGTKWIFLPRVGTRIIAVMANSSWDTTWYAPPMESGSREDMRLTCQEANGRRHVSRIVVQLPRTYFLTSPAPLHRGSLSLNDRPVGAKHVWIYEQWDRRDPFSAGYWGRISRTWFIKDVGSHVREPQRVRVVNTCENHRVTSLLQVGPTVKVSTALYSEVPLSRGLDDLSSHQRCGVMECQSGPASSGLMVMACTAYEHGPHGSCMLLRGRKAATVFVWGNYFVVIRNICDFLLIIHNFYCF